MTDRLIVGDAFDELDKLSEASVDCVVTSPPYWGLRDYGIEEQYGVEESAADFVEDFGDIGEKLARVLKPDGSLWLNLGDTYNGSSVIRRHSSTSHARKGDDGYADQLSDNRADSGVKRRSASQYGLARRARLQIPDRVAVELGDRGWILRDEVIWSKPDPKPEGRVSTRLTQSHEKIYRFVLEEGAKFDRGAVDAPVDVWTIPTADGEHPAPFPDEIPRRAIKLTTDEGDVVLDPFAGSGTTLSVARELSRESVGIELNSEFADIARERVSAVEGSGSGQIGLSKWGEVDD